MVTKYERQLERAAVAKQIREHADTVHAIATMVPFRRIDDTGNEIVMRDGIGGAVIVTLHGMYAETMAKWLRMLDKTSGMALAELIRMSASTDEYSSVRDAALKLLQEMGLEPKPDRYRPARTRR